ncbi:MAG: hypothetical protein Q8T08_15695 [Ignavibacteria bacterium]|nr:hypothetical protein [Ignavibacteria bacterium]
MEKLKSIRDSTHLSIYASSIGSSDSNRIQLKNILHEYQNDLSKTAHKVSDIDKMFQPANKLLDDNSFWAKYTHGLVLFISPNLFKYYYLPKISKLDIISLGQSFDLNPLQKIMSQNKSYYVLALSHKNCCMYEGDQYNISKLNLPNLPTNMEKSLNIDEHQKCSETHTIASPGSKKGSEAYHGQYNVSQTDKEMLLKFFQKIDKYLHNLLQKNGKPLIISGVNYLLPIYKKANTYKGLVDRSITGNQEHARPQDIRDKAWKIIQ